MLVRLWIKKLATNTLFLKRIYKNFFYENTNIVCHLPINVFYESDALFDVRMSGDAVDVKINEYE